MTILTKFAAALVCNGVFGLPPDDDGGLRARQRADMAAPGGQPVESLKGGAIGALLELPPFRPDIIEPMMDRNVDRRRRCRRGVARARRRAIRPALVDDERIGHSTAFFEVAFDPRKQISIKRWAEKAIPQSGTDFGEAYSAMRARARSTSIGAMPRPACLTLP